MLKIRISGSKSELEQISIILQDAHISQFRHKNGKMTYAIDSTISARDFIASNQATVPPMAQQQELDSEYESLEHNSSARETNIKSITQDLNVLLDGIKKE